MKRLSALLLACGLVGTMLVDTAFAKKDAVSVARGCRKALGRAYTHLAQLGFREVDRCEARKAAGRTDRDCTVLRTGSPTATGYRRWEHRAKLIAQAHCPVDSTARISFPVKEIGAGRLAGDPTLAVPEIAGAIQASARQLQGATAGAATIGAAISSGDCLAAIAAARSLVSVQTMQDAVRCQRRRDGATSTFGPLDPACESAPPDDAVRSAAGRIAGGCTGIVGPEIGTCAPLPGCVIDAAAATGLELARIVFGECGNGEVDAGEQCDDGNDDPEDDCNQCLAPVCGNGRVEGPEECDDGNQFPNDGCTDCRLGFCGDGNADAGEECDDGNDVADDGCTECRYDPVACSGGGVVATVTFQYDALTFVPIVGMKLRLTYDPTAVSIPGSLVGPSINQRVKNLTGVTPASYGVADRDLLPEAAPDGVDETLQTIIALSSGEIPSGPFEQVRFDCLGDEIRGAVVTCSVHDVTDPFLNKVPDATAATSTRCTITFETAPAQ